MMHSTTLQGSGVLVALLVLLGGCDGADQPAPAESPSTSPSSPVASPSAEPSVAPTPSSSPTPAPTATATDEPADSAASGDAPPSSPALAALDAPRVVVRHDEEVWARVDGTEWRRIGPAQDVQVVGDGRWWYEWEADPLVLHAVGAPDATCDPPPGFAGAPHTAVVHEGGLTSVFVADEDGAVRSVVCEEPGRDSPIPWQPPTSSEFEAGYGPIVLVDDGVHLVLEADAEGNVTVDDPDGNRLIDYAISGPYADGARELLVYVAIEGGMHFAGGTLVVTDLDGDQLRQVDLDGTSTLSALHDGRALVERVELPEFEVLEHLLVDVTTGEILQRAPNDVAVLYAGD